MIFENLVPCFASVIGGGGGCRLLLAIVHKDPSPVLAATQSLAAWQSMILAVSYVQ